MKQYQVMWSSFLSLFLSFFFSFEGDFAIFVYNIVIFGSARSSPLFHCSGESNLHFSLSVFSGRKAKVIIASVLKTELDCKH